MAVLASLQTENSAPHSPCPNGGAQHASPGSLNDALQEHDDGEYGQRNDSHRPDWASDFDVDLIDSLRDVVNFLD